MTPSVVRGLSLRETHITANIVDVKDRIFAAAAFSPDGDWAVLDAAKAMALTTADLVADPALLARAWNEFSSSEKR